MPIDASIFKVYDVRGLALIRS